MIAALRAIHARQPKTLVGAVTVASPDAAQAMLHECDAMVCLTVPSDFFAVGQFFNNFDQVTDEEVIAILKQDIEKAAAVG